MEKRAVQRLGRELSVIGLGTWQLGADWGTVDPDDARATLDAAIDAGIRRTTIASSATPMMIWRADGDERGVAWMAAGWGRPRGLGVPGEVSGSG